MRYGALVLGLVMSLVGAMPALAADDDPRWLFSSSVNYSIGDYGTNKDTTIVYVPFTFGVRPIDSLWISATVPWIYQNSQNVVVTGGGVATRKKATGKFAQPATATSESGLGDVLLKASSGLGHEKAAIPGI